jgi:uncharacterized protein YndB with AHSA1/START domain
MGRRVYAVWIKARPAQVWDMYVDPDRIPEWQTGKPVIGDVHGLRGEPCSTYFSRRGWLAARTTVLTSAHPDQLVTRTDAYFGLRLTITSRLTDRAGGTHLELAAETHWPPGRRLVGRFVERVILSPREADKELRNLKAIIERRTVD